MAATGLLRPTKTEIGPSGTSLVYEPGLPEGDFLEEMDAHLEVNVTSMTDEECEFEMKGITAPIANALRRILLDEVPSMAFETVYMHENTSIVQDEVLSHRIGLVPIFADPREFDMPPEDRDATEMDTIVFGLEVTGTESTGGDGLTHVYSRDLTWAPQGAQAERFADSPIRPVHDDILLAKLLPGQSIRMEVHAVKGIGADHAKFSPVATASYRLAPDIELSGRGFVGDEARQLVAACPMGVFDIEDVGSSGPRAVVKRPRACTTCRECLRPEGWADRVHLRKVNEHFLFRVESTGALPATTLVDMALRILADKARRAAEALRVAERGVEGGVAGIDVAAGGIATAGTVAAGAADDEADDDEAEEDGAVAGGTGEDAPAGRRRGRG